MEYVTIKGFAQDELVEKRSRFIGFIKQVSTEEQALEVITQKRSEYWDATHNVYAYILREGGIKRFSDDKEPQGTAGIPVLEVINKSGLCDVVVVVTRYFGGTLLGAGGLVRAYSGAAKLCIDAAQRMVMSPCTELSMDMDYAMYGKVKSMLSAYKIKELDRNFGAAVTLKILMQDSILPTFKDELREQTSATVHPYEGEKYYYNME